MPLPLTLQDLDPRDVVVVWDLIRFGALADYQIERRYGGSAGAARLDHLKQHALVEESDVCLAGAHVWIASDRAFFMARFGLSRHTIREWHLGHDIAVVDLADHLIARHPAATWRAESQIKRTLELMADGRIVARPDQTRKPDGLLIDGERVIAVELEHSIKSVDYYGNICRWYAAEIRVSDVWWFTDHPAIEARIRDVNRQWGFEHDISVKYEPFPPGVVVRQRARP